MVTSAAEDPEPPGGGGERAIGRRPGPAPAEPASAPPDGQDERPGPSTPPAVDLQVQVINGNLAYIDEPLFIGHYSSMALAGAERAVNEQIGGTMAKALALQAGHYPDALGSHQAFENLKRNPDSPHDMPKPAAVVVVGLGPEAALTEQGLTGTVRQAVLDWLQRHHERQVQLGASAPAEISATLIGSGGFGVTPGASARAIVAAVLDANRRVQAVDWPPVARLSLIELYLDRASDAWRELRLMAATQQGRAAPFTLAPQIEARSGGKRRPLDSSYRGADYDLVRIFGRGKAEIQYAMDSRRARSEVRNQSTQHTLVRELVRQAATHRQVDPRLGNTLFKLLVPPEIEPYLLGPTRLILDMSPSVASLPWEMLDGRVPPGPGEAYEPWAVRTGLLRKMQVASERASGRHDSLTEDHALVIGDPLLPPELQPWQLPHARTEARQVAALLRAPDMLGEDRVVPLDQQDALTIANTLYERDWRVIHIAGHGHWAGGRGGVMLSQPDTFLGPKEIRAMRAVPELVFINCCHLADLGSGDPQAAERLQRFEPGDLAQGVAAELIRAGVRCVVAAGWAVDDQAAACFAKTFYDTLRRGERFAEAAAAARRDTYAHERASQRGAGEAFGNTWAAYQCYGDPDWRLMRRKPTPGADGPKAEDRYGHIAHAPALALALESLAIDARWGRMPADRVLADVRWLVDRYGQAYGASGAVAEAFGLAFDEAGDSEQAIRWYGQAAGARDASASFQALERLGNVQSRWAYERARDGGAETARALLPELRRGLEILEANARARDTDEAHCLVGSARKRLAQVQEMLGTDQAAITQLMVSTRTAYEAGLDRAMATDGTLEYPLSNLLAIDLRLRLGPACAEQVDATQRLARWFRELDAALTRQAERKPSDEWVRLSRIEIDLQRAIAEEPPKAWDAHLDRLAEHKRRVPGLKMWRSARDQWAFILADVVDPVRQAMGAALMARLEAYARAR